jgi:uncharacterized protein YggU (UPF0235/DUF167 family)
MYIKVKVFPGSKKESFLEISSLRYEARVKEPAERNLANGRVIELVARHFELPNGKVRLVSGHRSPSKILSVENGE